MIEFSTIKSKYSPNFTVLDAGSINTPGQLERLTGRLNAYYGKLEFTYLEVDTFWTFLILGVRRTRRKI